MNTFKQAWREACGSDFPQGRKDPRMKILRNPLRYSQGRGRGKFQQIFIPMVEHVADVSIIINPFAPPKMRHKAIQRTYERMFG